jgi:hypothetical protein
MFPDGVSEALGTHPFTAPDSPRTK